ncbi:MAG: hypothetical protein QOG45_1707 [Chloroflexota bacterium]|jgi:hypothetical protein|nr:hypothetical protein [Chloroflexota bacterium]
MSVLAVADLDAARPVTGGRRDRPGDDVRPPETRGPDGEALQASCLLPCMLLILSERPGDARAVAAGLEGFGFRCDIRGAGRRLRSLERCALVRRCAPRPGVEDRRFRLTRRGRARLDTSAEAIAAISRRLEAFFERCDGRQPARSMR